MHTRTLSSLKLFGVILFSILFLEIFFEARVLNFEFDITFITMIIFSFSYTILIMFFVMFFEEKTVKRMMYSLLTIITFLYLNQEIYNSFVEGFYSLAVAGSVTDGLSFIGDYITSIRFVHIFYILPLLSLFLLSKYNLIEFKVDYSTLKRPLILLITGTFVFFLALQTIDETFEDSGAMVTYSDMDLYTYMYNSQEALKKFGLLTYTQRDFFSLFRSDPLSESEYDILIKDYFESQPNHIVNDFSGIFSDKNLILIMAESFDTFAINEELTPVLYDMKMNNTYFENYYSPLYYRSTADTEFLVQTSMFPNKDVALSMDAYSENTFLYTLPIMFESRGYETLSFHNYIDYFYPRSEFQLEALGYNSYYGPDEMGMDVNNSNNTIIFNHDWQSDYDMMVAAVPEFINEDKFFVNMLTVSGHFKYSDSHPIAAKNEQEVKDYEDRNNLNLDEEIFYYLAANIELDKAVGYLIDELEANNRLEETVIVIFGDHYAYGIDDDTIWDYDDIKEDDSEMDLHNVPLLIYSDSFILNGTIDNYMSSIDMIPTLSNLFNLPLDYGMVFGNDALANDENIVRFANLSFVSSKFNYDSLSEDMVMDDDIDSNYIDYLSNTFINDYKYNVLVLEYDYFKEDEDDETTE